MALKHSGKAIGMVSELLREYLERYHPAVAADQLAVKVARPLKQGNLPLLTIYLYEAHLDQHLRNTSPIDGNGNWLWYELHYLITAFDASGESDSDQAQGYLGEAARVLQGLGFLPIENVVPALDPEIVLALKDNPEQLKITFDEARADLISRVMLTNDKYHFSLAFQVRPVMIAPADLAQFSQQVGIDYSNSPNVVIGAAGVHTEVLPSMGPTLNEVSPTAVRPGDELMLLGTDLAGPGLQAWLGDVELPIVAQTSAGLKCKIPLSLDDGSSLEAGDHALRVSVTLNSGRKLWSNAQFVALLPQITGGSATNVQVQNHPITGLPLITADLQLDGNLLGSAAGSVLVGLLRNGVHAYSFDSFSFAVPNHQKSLSWSLTDQDQVSPGSYLVLVRVNGQQARTSITFTLNP